MAVIGEVLAVVGGQGHDLPERALREQLADRFDVRQKARPHRLHQKQPFAARQRNQLRRLLGVHRERLFDEHRLARSSASRSLRNDASEGVAT